MSRATTIQPEKVLEGCKQIGIPHGAAEVPARAAGVSVGIADAPGRPKPVAFCPTSRRWGLNVAVEHYEEALWSMNRVADRGVLSDQVVVEYNCPIPAPGDYSVYGRMSANGSVKFVVDGFVADGEAVPEGDFRRICAATA